MCDSIGFFSSDGVFKTVMVTDGFVGTNEVYTRGYLWAEISQRRYETVIVKGQSQQMLNSLLFFFLAVRQQCGYLYLFTGVLTGQC